MSQIGQNIVWRCQGITANVALANNPMNQFLKKLRMKRNTQKTENK
jgi:hypothetical protein